MWHFLYLKQNNHKKQRLFVNLVSGITEFSFEGKSRHNWRFEFQFPHSSSTTLATYQKWPLICLHIFYTEHIKLGDYHFWSMYLLKLGLNLEADIQIFNGIYLSTAALLVKCKKRHYLGQSQI